MKIKYITDELIAQEMAKMGWIEGCDDEHARNQVLAYYNCEITDQWQNPDFSIYEESTADGYSVWIASANTSNININEDVYYYDSDLSDALFEAIPDYNQIYCDDYSFVEDAITRHYEDLMFRVEEEIELDLILPRLSPQRVTQPFKYTAVHRDDHPRTISLIMIDSAEYCGFINVSQLTLITGG